MTDPVSKPQACRACLGAADDSALIATMRLCGPPRHGLAGVLHRRKVDRTLAEQTVKARRWANLRCEHTGLFSILGKTSWDRADLAAALAWLEQ